MQRDLRSLSDTPFDLVIVGGGAYGAFAAWIAAQFGLKTALLEAVDFGHATSGSSLRTVHGGLRYLQHLDLRRMRESIRERRTLTQLAPDLIEPMPFVMPTFGRGVRSPEAFRLALALNDLIAIDRNSALPPERALPAGRVLNRAETTRMLGALRVEGFNGGALWYDGFNRDPERLLLRVVMKAVALGAHVVNHARVTRILVRDGKVVGVTVQDEIGGQVTEVRTKFVLNAAGPWADDVVGPATCGPKLVHRSLALNLIVKRVALDVAVGIPVSRRSRDSDAILNSGSWTYFVMPWGRFSLVGTYHLHSDLPSDQVHRDSDAVIRFLDELGPAAGEIGVRHDRVIGVLAGHLPARPAAGLLDDVQLIKHPVIVHHDARGGPSGLVSIVGVKWTTSRLVAERAVREICARMGMAPRHLARTVALEPTDCWGETSAAPDVHLLETTITRATGTEMAVTLEDLIRRRTGLWLSESLDDALLYRCAAIMGRELRWSGDTIEQEVTCVRKKIERLRRVPPSTDRAG